MLGGVGYGDTRVRLRTFATPDKPRWATPTGLALLISVLLSVAVGVLLQNGYTAGLAVHDLGAIRQSLHITGGALFFGAGLIQLSIWRVDGDVSRSYEGVAMVVFGLSASFLSGLGYLVYSSSEGAALNPHAFAITAIITVAIAMTARDEMLSERQPRPARMALAWLATIALLFSGLTFVRRLQLASLDLPVNWHLGLEVGIATLWLATAALTLQRHRWVLPGMGRHGAPLLATLGMVWVLRSVAVLEPLAWGVASVLLLTAAAIVVLTEAMTVLSQAAESEHARVESAEAALVDAHEELAEQDQHRRDLRHDAKNAIIALRVATQILAEHGERMDPETRQRMRQAILEEVGHLDELISPRVPSQRSVEAVLR